MGNDIYSGQIAKMRNKFADYLRLRALKYQIRQERMELGKLDEFQLKDIGISHDEAAKEATKSFADIPVARIINKGNAHHLTSNPQTHNITYQFFHD